MLPKSKRKRQMFLNSEDNSNTMRKRNQNTGMIVENTNLPLRILECKQGQTTQRGTKTLYFTFQHLISKEEFQSTVFENSVPDYIDTKIVDAVLPPDIEEYELVDLINKGLFAQVKFRRKNETIFINVVKVASLDKQYRGILANLIAEEEEERKNQEKEIEEIEDEFDDLNQEDEQDFDLDELDFEEED